MMISAMILSVLALIAALGVVLLKNPLFSAFSLVLNLLCVAAVYASMDAHFLAVSQVVVYAGAIMVLVLFVLMLLNLKNEADSPRAWIKVTAACCGAAVLLSSIIPILISAIGELEASAAADATPLEGTVLEVGRLLYTRYVPQFELSSLVLLVGVVGAVMLTRKKSVDPGPRKGGLVGGNQS